MRLNRRLELLMLVVAVPVFVGLVTYLLLSVNVGPATVTVAFLDVGQGDAAVIRRGSSETLVDCGPDRSVLVGLGRAMPFLDRTIETVVITHPHADHYEGLAAVLERYRVNRLVLGSANGLPQRLRELVLAASANGTSVVSAADGPLVEFGDGVSLRVQRPTPGTSADPNDASLVLSLWTPCRWVARSVMGECEAALLMADAGVAAETAIEATPAAGVWVLKASHHGSSRATTRKFLDAIRPAEAVISVGRNFYGHPSPLTLKRLSAAGVPVWRTDRDGAVKAVFGPDGPLIGPTSCPGWLIRRQWCGQTPQP